MSNEAKLGILPKGDEGRDAVHVAIIPVQASEDLSAGFVRLDANGKAMRCDYKNAIGVADPFMQHPAKKDSWFWLCLFPKTIKGLRHVWEHPAFPRETSPPPGESDERKESEAWVKDYVRRHCPYWHEEPDSGYSEFMRYVEQERLIFYYGSDCHGLDDVEDADELFSHLSVILGRPITASYFEAFTCSC